MSPRTRRIVRMGGLFILLMLLFGITWGVFQLFYNPAVPLAEPRLIHRPLSHNPITILLGGDFAPTDEAMPHIRAQGYRYPYEATANLLRDVDISFLNLEAPVTASLFPYPLFTYYKYRVEPQATAAWQWLGLDLISLANNHINDYRARGVLDTVQLLDQAHIAHIGAGANESLARRPVIYDLAGTRIGFLAYLEDGIGYNLYLRLFAAGQRPGCARFVRTDVQEDLRRLRPLVDLVLVSLHFGDNYAPITRAQEENARWLVDQGVDVVIGHHAHDIQDIETRGRSVIFYSLGNYAWGTPGHPHFRLGFLARLGIVPRQQRRPAQIISVEVLPIVTQNRIVEFQPRLLRPDEIGWLDDVIVSSRRRGTNLVLEETTLRVQLLAP